MDSLLLRRLVPAVAIFALLLAATSRGAEPQPPQPPAVETPQYTSVRTIAEGITRAELSNGLTVLVEENHTAPVATVRSYVKNTGGAFEGRYLGAGLSHVLEHVVAGGTTTKRSEKEISRIIDTFGGATNAFTSDHLTAFFVNCPAKDVLAAVDLVADSMQHIKFEPSEFERELRVVKRELADGEVDRERVLFKMLNQTIYTESPARHPVIGYLDVLNRTSNAAIIDFYHERYVPNNMVFVVVGDVKTQDVLDQVAKQWIGTPRGNETFIPMPDEPEQLAPREAYREMDGATYDVALAWPTVRLSHEDLYALDLAAYILGEGESSRMVRKMKYDKQLVLSVNTASYTPHFVRGWFGVFAAATPENWKPAVDEALREVYSLRDELIGPAELAKAKKQKAAEQVLARQTVHQAADSLGRDTISAGDPLFDNAYVEGIQKVTAEQIRDVARRYLVPQRLNRVVIAPPDSAATGKTLASAAADGKIRMARLPNGLRVLLKRQSNLPLVNLQAYVLGGALVDTPETAGRSKLVGEMLDQGTAQHTAAQIAEYFDSIGGHLNFTAGRNTVYGSMTTLRDDFSQAAALFAECFLRPSFPEEQFRKIKQLALGAISRRADDPQQEAFELFYDRIPATSPFHVLQGGKKETVEKLRLDELKAYHAKYFVPNNMVVTVFGDIDPDHALALVKEQFGSLKLDPAFQPISFDRSSSIPATIVDHKQTAKPTGMVLMGYPVPSIRDEKDEAALTVLDAILSGYSYPGGWLHNELRGAGLVYYVHAFLINGPVPGYFAVMSQTQPDKVQEVVTRIQRNLERARSGQIPKDEFDTALQMIVALHAQENTTIAEKAQEAATHELMGLGYNYNDRFDERIQAVTLPQVVDVAKRYLDKHILVTSSPAEK
jgi:zinc protease